MIPKRKDSDISIFEKVKDITVNKKVNSSFRDIGCGIILLDDKDRIILGTRTDLPDFVHEKIANGEEEYKWTIPGGGLEKGESPMRCALRELEEEFGIKAGIQTYTVELVDYTDKFYLKRGQIKYKRDFTFITRLKRSTIDDIIPQKGEIGEVKAFTKEEALNLIVDNKIYKASKSSILMALKYNRL